MQGGTCEDVGRGIEAPHVGAGAAWLFRLSGLATRNPIYRRTSRIRNCLALGPYSWPYGYGTCEDVGRGVEAAHVGVS